MWRDLCRLDEGTSLWQYIGDKTGQQAVVVLAITIGLSYMLISALSYILISAMLNMLISALSYRLISPLHVMTRAVM